jgi:uncharacterized protein (DUF4415 family)
MTGEVRINDIAALPLAPALSMETLALSESEIETRAANDPDAGVIPDGFWNDATVIEPEGTEQITLRLPRRILRHFRASGKGYQSRISAVLASYVDAKTAR